MAISETTPGPEGDGRTRRRVRNREKVVQALYELIGEGHRRPTADQVAERAGVGRRTVFRHFDDLESLFAELAQQVREQARVGRAPRDTQGTLDERIDLLVSRRAELFERLAPFRRSNQVHVWRSPVLQRFDAENAEELRADTHHALPELVDASAAVRRGVEHITSPAAWDGLREQQELEPEAARAVVRDLVRLLLGRD